MKQFQIFIFVFLGLVILTAPFNGMAKEPIRSFDTLKLSREVTLTKPAFDKLTRIIQETPQEDTSLAFRMRLPHNFAKFTGGGSRAGELSRYLGPSKLDLRSSLEVTAFQLDFLITAKNWFLNYATAQNFSLQGLEETDNRRVQAHYVKVDSDGNQYVVRAVAQISGPKIILAEYVVPIQAWTSERDLAIWGMASFVLTSPGSEPPEPIDTYAFLDIAKIDYPKSWTLAPQRINNVERMAATLANIKGRGLKKVTTDFNPDAVLLDGRIDVMIVAKASGATLAGEAAELRKNLLAKGLVLGELIGPIQGWKAPQGAVKNYIEVYKLNNVQNRLASYEEWVGLFETPDYIYVVALLTLGRDENFYTWIQNTEAYKMVIASLGPAKSN